MKRTQSANELDLNDNKKKIKKKNKKKERSSSSTLDQILMSSNTSPINKSYSDVDYFPLMPGALSQSNNHGRTLQFYSFIKYFFLNI